MAEKKEMIEKNQLWNGGDFWTITQTPHQREKFSTKEMAENNVNKMSEKQLLPNGGLYAAEIEIRRKTTGTKHTGPLCIFLCVLIMLCIGVFTFFLCQLYQNFGKSSYRIPDIRIHPSSYLKKKLPQRNRVHDIVRGIEINWPSPPPSNQAAKVARYVVHTSDWASIATHSVQIRTSGFPFSDILSLSDGPVMHSSGIPYMYLTPKDLTSQDILNDTRASITVSNALSEYCHVRDIDPLSPLCARILITGHITKVQKNSGDETKAKDAVFSRHPEMSYWPKDHHWFFAKMVISHIFVLDFFGGATEVGVDDYFSVKPF